MANITTMSSREFNHDAGKAKKAAETGPVFITDRGEPKYVLLSVHEFRRLSKTSVSIVEMLAMPAAADIKFEPETLPGNLFHPVDFGH